MLVWIVKAEIMVDARREGMTEVAKTALKLFATSVLRTYGVRLQGIVVFGSRARGDARNGSDLDVSVILSEFAGNRYAELMALSDLAYDAIVETGVHVQPWPVTLDEWHDPERHVNPVLVRAMRRDGRSAGDYGLEVKPAQVR